MKILIAEDEPELRKLLVFMVQSTIGATVMEVASGKEAIETLQENPDIQCVISDYQMPDGTGEDVYRYLMNQPKNIPFILCSPIEADQILIFKNYPPFGTIVKPDIFSGFEFLLRKLAEQFSEKLLTEEYCPIRMTTVLSFGLLYGDLYFKLNDDKYIKVMREGDTFDVADFERFDAKNVDFLYVRTQDAKRILGKMHKNLNTFTANQSGDDKSNDQDLKISTASLEVIHEFSQILGFAAETQQLTRECVSFSVKTIQKNPKLAQLYAQLTVDSESYLSSHSVVLANVACGIASLLGWNSQLIFYELSLAAFLHDITLTSNALARVQLLKELEYEDPPFTVEEKKRFFQHPEQAARLASEFSDIPSGVISILQQHHERPDGSGFPAGLTETKITPMAAVFIVAHDLVSFRAKISTTAPLADFAKSLEGSFHKGQFKKITAAIAASMAENLPSAP